MNNESVYWLWLAKTLGAGAKTADIINYFGSARMLYEKGSREWRLSGILTASQINKLSLFSPSQFAETLRVCVDNGWRIITPDSEYYPKRLREIADPPSVLFVWGDETILNSEVMLSVVGTRKASNYSMRVTRLLSSKLARAGAVIVSGGALGVDSAAHTGAMEGGRTIAVLGCGFGTDYLRDNAALRREISKNGAVITEYFPFTPASRTTFPMRNRIISGMSLGTIVVEAGERSGSLITARLALSEGRDVFAVPGEVITSAFTGTNRLIHDGAKPVFTALDVLEEYYYTYPDKIDLSGADKPLGEALKNMPIEEVSVPEAVHSAARQKSKTAQKKAAENTTPQKSAPRELTDSLTENAKKLYSVLTTEPRHIDDLSEEAKLSSADTLAALTELELYSLVALSEGKHYYKV